MTEDYNGWKNRQTWNVALWIENEESLYRAACAYAKERKEKGKTPTYSGFVKRQWLANVRTPDNISYSGTRLDRKALDEMIQGLA